ncbi:hypothetical protein FOA52_006010 [Chlamydomonas sp. UWO 241]|nr:hypothetical protein FOA52_006010 [Chlamydomonas sp. UWO 241]
MIVSINVVPSKPSCPCGSGIPYADCCQKLHKVQQMKSTGPEQLLRARFAAYVKRDWKYVVRTTHSAAAARAGSTSADGKIKTTFEQDVKVTMSWVEMSGLTVGDVRPVGDGASEINFWYDMKQVFELSTGERIKNPEVKTIKECARFEMEDGEWKLLSSESNWDRNKMQEV